MIFEPRKLYELPENEGLPARQTSRRLIQRLENRILVFPKERIPRRNPYGNKSSKKVGNDGLGLTLKCIWGIPFEKKSQKTHEVIAGNECPVVHKNIGSVTTEFKEHIAKSLCRWCPIRLIYIQREAKK